MRSEQRRQLYLVLRHASEPCVRGTPRAAPTLTVHNLRRGLRMTNLRARKMPCLRVRLTRVRPDSQRRSQERLCLSRLRYRHSLAVRMAVR